MKTTALFFNLTSATAALTSLQGIETRQSNWTVGQTVQTSSGPVTGHAAKNDSQVSEYLGIPFGQAPIGELRFAAPVRFNGSSPLNGTDYGPSCPLKPSSGSPVTSEELAAANFSSVAPSVLAILSNDGAVYDEDCLYLNVWTKPQVGEKLKAVMVWIYGGGFSSGSSSIPGYNGANIVEQEDVVLVSINYRLSILGFSGNPNGTQNVALLDQRLAVEWVRDNIENFGGDPSRITIFGQSAGSASVDFYTYAWAKDPIVAGAIAESGNAFGWGLPNSKVMAATAWFNVSVTLGCGDNTTDSARVLACMQKQNYTDILKAVPNPSGTAGILGLFGPTVDDTVVFANYTTVTPAKVPMLIGNNNYEGGLFRTEFAVDGIFFSDAFWDDFNLQEFTCPAGIRANVSWAAGTPIWRYRYFGVFPDLAISSEAGTWHASEIPIIFDTTPVTPGPTTDEISIANYMRGAWTTFAKDPAKGLSTYGEGWPTYDPTKDTLIRLAYNNVTGTNAASPYIYDAYCSFVDVHSTNTSAVPSINPSIPPTSVQTSSSTTAGGSSSTGSATGAGTSATASVTGTGAGATGSATGIGASATASTQSGLGSRAGMSVWVMIAAGLAAWLI